MKLIISAMMLIAIVVCAFGICVWGMYRDYGIRGLLVGLALSAWIAVAAVLVAKE